MPLPSASTATPVIDPKALTEIAGFAILFLVVCFVSLILRVYAYRLGQIVPTVLDAYGKTHRGPAPIGVTRLRDLERPNRFQVHRVPIALPGIIPLLVGPAFFEGHFVNGTLEYILKHGTCKLPPFGIDSFPVGKRHGRFDILGRVRFLKASTSCSVNAHPAAAADGEFFSFAGLEHPRINKPRATPITMRHIGSHFLSYEGG